MQKLVSQSEYARIKNCSRQYISRLVKAGKITLVKGKIDVKKANQELRQIADPARALIVTEKNDFTENINTSELNAFAKARTAREIYKAKLLKLEYEKKIKLYVETSKVERELFEASRAVRDNLYLIPNRVSGIIATMTNETEIKQMIKKEINIALEAFQNAKIS